MIFKREDDSGVVGDLRDSPFVKHIWPLDPEDRSDAWNIVVEGLALGADPARVKELADKWQCDDEDADIYADFVGCVLRRDGNMWHATRRDFENIQESKNGFGATKLEAMAELAKDLGLTCGKMWPQSFAKFLQLPDP